MSDLRDAFLIGFMKSLLYNYRTPNVQVKATLEIILSTFIEDVAFIEDLVNRIYKYEAKAENCIKYLSNQFPIKKKNNQSWNVDFLLMNRTKIFLVELKISSSSYRKKQLDFYLELQSRVRSEGAGFLIEDLDNIRKTSKELQKYDFLIQNFENKNLGKFNEIRKLEVLFIGPESMRKKLELFRVNFKSFTDLSNINISPNNEVRSSIWEIISSYLKFIDKLDLRKDISDDELVKAEEEKLEQIHIYKTVFENISQLESFDKIKEIRLSSSKVIPNYQIYFNDGTPPWAFNCRTHQRYEKNGIQIIFDEKELDPPVSIEFLKNVFDRG